MPKDTLDIEHEPEREVREYSVKRGSWYIQTKQYSKEGNLEKEIWERDSVEGDIILKDAAYISKKKAKELEEEINSKRFTNSELIQLGKKEEYIGYEGVIVMLYKNRIYFSSEVVKIEPAFGEEYVRNNKDNEDEYKIDA